VQAEQHSEAFQSARRGEVAAETSKSEEQRPEPVCVYAYRTTVNPGVSMKSAPVPVASPEPAAIMLPLKDLLAILARASAEARSPVSKERQPQAVGASDRSGGLTVVEALATRKCEEAVAAHMPVASATVEPVGPEASTPRPMRAVAQTEPAVTQPDPESIILEVHSKTNAETSPEQDVQAATSLEEALKTVQHLSEPTSELASITNREVLQRPVPFPFLPTPHQCTPTLGFLGIRAPRIARSCAKPQQTDSDSFAGDRESQNPIAPAPHSVRSVRKPETSHFKLAASLP
jgi:hypothetical protein